MTFVDFNRRSDTSSDKQSRRDKFANCLCSNAILILTIIAVSIGAVAGFMLRVFKLSDELIILIGFPGELMMNTLKLLILPLIVSSLITGLARLGTKSSSRMGVITISYFLTTSVIAALTGIAMVLLIHPGDPKMKADLGTPSQQRDVYILDTLLDLLRNVFPDNLVQATFRQVQTSYVKKDLRKATLQAFADNASSILDLNETSPDALKIIRVLEYKSGANILGIITFCLAFGISMAQLGPKAKPLTSFFAAMDAVTMRLIQMVMWISPLGITSLIAAKILQMGDVLATMEQLAFYMAAVLGGFAIHGLVTLPLTYYAFTRKNPFVYLGGLLQACLTALGTGSSAATLPTTFRCLEENNNIDRRVTGFVLPIGTTVNMDGGALFEAVAAIFIAQVNGIELDFGQVATISLTATLASIGNAAIPNAALVTMLLVLTAVGLPTSDVSLIVAVDWLLDRFRTSVNVMGDAFGAGIVHHLCQKELYIEMDDVSASNITDGEAKSDAGELSETIHAVYNPTSRPLLEQSGSRKGFDPEEQSLV